MQVPLQEPQDLPPSNVDPPDPLWADLSPDDGDDVDGVEPAGDDQGRRVRGEGTAAEVVPEAEKGIDPVADLGDRIALEEELVHHLKRKVKNKIRFRFSVVRKRKEWCVFWFRAFRQYFLRRFSDHILFDLTRSRCAWVCQCLCDHDWVFHSPVPGHPEVGQAVIEEGLLVVDLGHHVPVERGLEVSRPDGLKAGDVVGNEELRGLGLVPPDSAKQRLVLEDRDGRSVPAETGTGGS